MNIESLLTLINQYSGLANWITAVVAVIALVYAIREYWLKKRPYIDIEIAVAENSNKQQGGYLFFAVLVNKGTYPGIARVKKTQMSVGDENYPSDVKAKLVLSPGESKKLALIGSIYKSGISKILGHEYRKNRAEIEIEVESGDIGSDKLQYFTRVVYELDVKVEPPNLLLIEEEFK